MYRWKRLIVGKFQADQLLCVGIADRKPQGGGGGGGGEMDPSLIGLGLSYQMNLYNEP